MLIMSDVHVRNVPAELISKLNVSAASAGVTQRTWIIEAFRFALAHGPRFVADLAENRESEPLPVKKKMPKVRVRDAVTGSKEIASELVADHTPSTEEIPRKYDGTLDTCVRCRTQLIPAPGWQTQCPNCGEKYRRML